MRYYAVFPIHFSNCGKLNCVSGKKLYFKIQKVSNQDGHFKIDNFISFEDSFFFKKLIGKTLIAADVGEKVSLNTSGLWKFNEIWIWTV